MIGAILAKREAPKVFDHIHRHDVDAIVDAAADDIVFEFPTDTVMGGRHEGKEAVRAWMERWFERMPEITFHVHHVMVEHLFALGGTNVVAVSWDLDETDREGHTYHVTGASEFGLEGGKVAWAKDYIFDQDVLREVWETPAEA